MSRKTKFIVIPCLLLSILLAGMTMLHSLSFFMDKSAYTVIFYPYDGRGEISATFSDNSTVSEFSGGEEATINYSFTNTSAATITEMTVTVTYPDDTDWSETKTLTLAPGETYTGSHTFDVTFDMTEADTGDGKYKPVTVSFLPTKITDDSGKEYSVSTNASSTVVYILDGEGE